MEPEIYISEHTIAVQMCILLSLLIFIEDDVDLDFEKLTLNFTITRFGRILHNACPGGHTNPFKLRYLLDPITLWIYSSRVVDVQMLRR